MARDKLYRLYQELDSALTEADVRRISQEIIAESHACGLHELAGDLENLYATETEVL